MKDIFLSSRHEVRLAELHQTLTYDGLLEGVPTREMNARTIEALRSRHDKLHVLEPVQTPIVLQRPYPFGEPASLPPVTCVARFDGPGFTDKVLFCSTLMVAWFQEDWALPIAEQITAQLETLPWSELAEEYEI